MDLERTCRLLDGIREGDRSALEELLARYGGRLRRMIRLRIHPRIRARVDEDDVIQEVLLEASQRLPRYLEDPSMPFFVWLRFLAMQRIADMHRRHLGAKGRDARREVRLDAGARSGATSAALADGLAGTFTTPSEAVDRADAKSRIARTLERMDEHDREILALRHFEQLTNREAAHELGLDVSAASKRYARALRRLKGLLEGA